MLQHHT